MEQAQRDLLSIIRSAITGEKCTLSPDFDLTAAIRVAQQHTIVAMLYDGMAHTDIPQTQPELEALFSTVYHYVTANEQQMYELDRLFRSFDAAQIDYMPLKGAVLKSLYPRPAMRAMSDADILIRTEQYDRIRRVMVDLGYTEGTESDHELIWYLKGMNLELHKRLIPSYNRDYFAYFGDGWRLAKVKEGTRYGMTPEDQWIYLFTHFAKHYRDAGIGIKHMVDLWVYRRAYPKLDEAYIRQELEKLRLNEFCGHVQETLAVWFDGAEDTPITDFITAAIFNSGVFGRHKAYVLSAALKTAKTAETASGGGAGLKRLFRVLFPSYQNMRAKYSILRRLPVLLPVMWVVRGFELVLFGRNKISAKRTDLQSVTAEHLDERLQALRLVGLNFDFPEE